VVAGIAEMSYSTRSAGPLAVSGDEISVGRAAVRGAAKGSRSGAIPRTELNSSKAFMGTNASCDYFRVLTSSAVERPKVPDSSRMARCGRFHASATIYRGRALPSS
jgi:hypothetical protein